MSEGACRHVVLRGDVVGPAVTCVGCGERWPGVRAARASILGPQARASGGAEGEPEAVPESPPWLEDELKRKVAFANLLIRDCKS